MRLPAHLDGLDPVLGMLSSIPPLMGHGKAEKRNHPADNISPIPSCLPSRTTINHCVIRLLAGGLLFLVASATHATAPVGATPGNLEVTTRGSASYTIPVVIPPGTRGIQPKLSLGYDSQAGNGFVGHGWSLGGLSVIHRCGATILLDGFKGGVKYDANDKFCLDGERLVLVDGVEYRTRHETWQRVIPSDMSFNPASFTVYAKDGYILEYGVTENSRIQAQGSANVRVWALNKMTDRLGNYYTISYQEDNANGDYRPDRIDYTGNAAQGLTPYNSVIFQYEARSDTPPRYEAGSVMKAMQRMTHVLSYTGTTLVRDYRLTYDNNGAVGRSRLTSVQECGTDGVCLPATQFGWQNGAVGYATTPIQFNWGTDKTSNAPIGFADINGDGQLDFWGWHSDGNIHVRRWGTSGFGSETTIAWSTNKTADGPVGFTDINGDGRADFWGWKSDGNIHVRLSNGDGTFASATTMFWSTTKSEGPVGFADINGDGRADFWGWSNDGNVYVRLSNGDGTFGASVATNWGTDKTYGATIAFADVNGDDKADLIGERNGTVTSGTYGGGYTYWAVERHVFVRLSNGDGSFGAELSAIDGFIICNTPTSCPASLSFGDINGDGNIDLNGPSSQSIYKDAISKGDGSFVVPTGAYGGTGFSDVNGDGRDDKYSASLPYAGTGEPQYCVSVFFSKGDGSYVGGPAISCGITTANNSPGFVDINGDGLADLYDWTSDGNIRVFLANPVMPDLLVSVTNGLGEQRQLTYKPLTDDTIYAPAQGETYSYREVQDATYVVRSAAKSDGLGGMATTYYTYGGQLMHVEANERLGFVWIQRWEPDGSWVNDYYHQDVNFSGTLSKSETYVAGSVLVKKTVNDWRLGTSSYNRIMNRLFGITEETYELNGSLVTRAVTATGYDDYGYPLTTTVTQLDGRKKTTVNDYFHDTTNWILGLKMREQVTAEAPDFTAETRTTDYGYYTGLGLLAYESVEPTDSAYTLTKIHEYDPFGNRNKTTISGTGIATRATTHTYDSAGRFLVRTTNALGHYETREHDPRNGQPTKHTGPNRLDTTWNYDGLGRKQGELRPDGTATAFDYAACDTSCPPRAMTRFTTTATAKGASVSYRDSLGREVQTATQGFNGAWIYKFTAYDQLGRAAQVSAPYFSGEVPLYTVSEYDALQRVFRVTAPGSRVTRTNYNGLSTTVTNPLNQATTIVKDSEGRAVEVIDAAAGQARSIFDPFGNLTQITDPAGNVTTMRYDRLGRKIETNDPDRGKWTYAYNVLGELKTQTDAALQVTTFAYDKLGRLTQRSAPEGATQWWYDFGSRKPIGKLFYVSAPLYEEWHEYDDLGREWKTSQHIGNGYYAVTRTFDAYSRLDVLTYPTGYTLKHVYDPYGNLTEVKDNQNGQSYWKATAANARGQITGEQMAGDTMTATHAYDPNTGYPSYDYTHIPGGMEIRRGMYNWDNVGNLTWRMYPSFIMESFGYDSLNRLTSVTGPANKTYGYSPNGNLTYKSDVGTYYYNGARPHAVNLILGNNNAWLFQYDANGNLTSGNGRTVTYASYNQPSSIIQGVTTATFKYGADYQRTVKAVNGVATRYIGSGLHEAAINGTTTTHRHYIYAGKDPIAIYSYDLPSGGSPTNLAVKYLHRDAIGSIEATTDATGNVLERLAYDAWGKRRNTNGTDAATITPQTPYGYTGHEHDDELKLINMKAREYDPYIARFLQPDPLGTQGDPHPYAYANNNPLKYTDPTGTSYMSFDSWSMGGSSSYQPWSTTWEGVNTIVADAKALNNRYNAPYASFGDNSWSLFNSSSSLGAFGSGGLSLTSYNTNWNSGGQSFTNIYDNFGSGMSTGVPLLPHNVGGYSPNNIPTQPSQPSSGGWSLSADRYGYLGVLGGGGTIAYSGGTLEVTARVGVGYGGGVQYDPSGRPSPHASSSGAGWIARTTTSVGLDLGLGVMGFGGSTGFVTGNAVTTRVGGEYTTGSSFLSAPFSREGEFGFRGSASYYNFEFGFYLNFDSLLGE